AAFVAVLEARLVAELEAPVSQSQLGGTSPTDEITLQLDRRDGPTPMIARTAVRPRRLGMAVLAAAAIVLVVTIAVASSRDHHVITSTPTTLESTTTAVTSPATTEPSTTSPETTEPSTSATPAPPSTGAPAVVNPGFQQAMSTDLTASGGSKLHFDGTIEFKVAIESNERSEQPNHDVLLLPRVTGTFTNIGAAATTIGDTQVQIFMSGDFPCLTADGAACLATLTIGSTDTAVIGTLQPGETYALDSASVTNRVIVPAGEVPYIIDEIANGGKVVGTSVSVLFDSTELQTTVFDRTGVAVQTCAALAGDCMDANRSVLGADAAPVDTSALGELAFPAGEAPAGTYAPAHFVLPYEITTGGPWQMVRDDNTATLLRRHDNAIVSALQVGEGSTLGAGTPAQALAALCAADTTQDPVPTAATLFGQDAIQIDGVVTASCAIEQTLKYGDLRTDRFRALATTVDGHVVYVIGVAPTNDWAAFSTEFDATVASLTLR
ncbi:MAG: hypothetical protein JWN39_1113, partial [Ilumatobacteraceae bacterium]|nr:hypothetical protein [Ilumatobacteraceae bacterium]